MKKEINSKRRIRLYTKAGIFVMIILTIVLGIREKTDFKFFSRYGHDDYVKKEVPEIDVKLLSVNKYSRPGIRMDTVKGIVIHYTANPGSTAMQNRNYFEGLKDTHRTKASSHFIIGLEGEIIQCIPTWEMAYASNSRNSDTIAVECCHPDKSGKFTKETYKSMVNLTAWLCEKYNLKETDVIRHYDVTGKNCPKYFVENEEAWKKFRKNIKKVLEE